MSCFVTSAKSVEFYAGCGSVEVLEPAVKRPVVTLSLVSRLKRINLISSSSNKLAFAHARRISLNDFIIL